MKVAHEVEWNGGVDGRLVLGAPPRETRSGQVFLDFVASREASFDIPELERIGSYAYFAAVCEVRSTTAGFVLAAADHIIDPAALVSSDPARNSAFQSGINRMRDFLIRIRAEPGGTLADAALGYVKLLAAP